MRQCPICLIQHELLEQHHIWPTSYGGPEDGQLIDICSNCHRGIHNTSESIAAHMKNNKKKIRYHLKVQEYERAKTLISTILEAKFKYNRLEDQLAKRKIILEIPQHLLTKLHKVKKDNGFSNLEEYLISVIKKEVAKDLQIPSELLDARFQD